MFMEVDITMIVKKLEIILLEFLLFLINLRDIILILISLEAEAFY